MKVDRVKINKKCQSISISSKTKQSRKKEIKQTKTNQNYAKEIRDIKTTRQYKRQQEMTRDNNAQQQKDITLKVNKNKPKEN